MWKEAKRQAQWFRRFLELAKNAIVQSRLVINLTAAEMCIQVDTLKNLQI